MPKSLSTIKQMLVYADWKELGGAQLMGTLRSEQLRGREVFSFAYDRGWLKKSSALLLDPDLSWFSGEQYNKEAKTNFGMFMDSSPDRWGRVLMQRKEALLAKRGDRKVRTLFESDYLLGVSDINRMGALRFRLDKDGPFLDDDQAMAVPPFTSLRSLEEASLRLEQEDIKNDADLAKWLNLLMAPGSSLGGARPKASVMDPRGQLWIAKFPSNKDDRDMGGWEAVAANLAVKAGINMSESNARRFTQKHHSFLTRRFDRMGTSRIHYASAKTLLGEIDGADAAAGISYLQIAALIVRNGARPQADLEELWRRIVFNIAISNTDDHLRNHGFLLTDKGWILSPAFDVNPTPNSSGLNLNITEYSNATDMELAREVAAQFRVQPQRSKGIIEQVEKAVRDWRKVAAGIGITRSEMQRMETAFIK